MSGGDKEARAAPAEAPKDVRQKGAALHHHLIAGIAGGVLTSLILHPIDLIKVRLQVQDGKQYRGIVQAVTKTWRNEGLTGFYRGVGPACWGSGASWGLYFHFYEAAKRRMARSDGAGLSTWQHIYAAWEGGTLTCLLTNPLWLIKTRMQLQGQGVNGTGVAASSASSSSASALKPYRGIVDAVSSIIREEGFLGLYRGLLPALLLTSHGMIQFAAYEEAKRAMPAIEQALYPSSSSSEAPASVSVDSAATHSAFVSSYLFFAAASSKAVATTATYPYQVLKARLQQRQSQELYKGFVDCFRRVWQNEGWRGFYRGFGANLLRVAPQSALTLSAYEATRKWLDHHHHN